MSTSIFETAIVRKLSVLVFILCIFISFKYQNTDFSKKNSSTTRLISSSSSTSLSSSSSSTSEDPSPITTLAKKLHPVFLSVHNYSYGEAAFRTYRTLEYDYYRNTCPQAEQIVRSAVRYLYRVRSNVAPALLRLLFHDCFIEGCDASVLLDGGGNIHSEKDSPPNASLKGFDIIDTIKEELEQACPGIVSCADILVLAAREGLVLAGGPFYPVFTGRRDSLVSFPDIASYELPAPSADLSETLSSFASKGFDIRETVSLLGAHSIGVIHCKTLQSRLYNFHGTNLPDPSLDPDFLNLMRSRCSNSSTDSSTPSQIPSEASTATAPDDLENNMAYDGPPAEFGTRYYQSLLQNKGILYADQQLMSAEQTGFWVKAYAADAPLFRRDFALAMLKLSNLRPLTAPMGQIRLHCAKVA